MTSCHRHKLLISSKCCGFQRFTYVGMFDHISRVTDQVSLPWSLRWSRSHARRSLIIMQVLRGFHSISCLSNHLYNCTSIRVCHPSLPQWNRLFIPHWKMSFSEFLVQFMLFFSVRAKLLAAHRLSKSLFLIEPITPFLSSQFLTVHIPRANMFVTRTYRDENTNWCWDSVHGWD